jgi:hypothetical protein
VVSLEANEARRAEYGAPRRYVGVAERASAAGLGPSLGRCAVVAERRKFTRRPSGSSSRAVPPASWHARFLSKGTARSVSRGASHTKDEAP